MRTTLTLDDDVAAFVEEQSHVQNKPVEQMVNETLRLGITQSTKPVDTHEFHVKPNNSGFVEGIDTVRLNKVLGDLDVEEFLAKDGQFLVTCTAQDSRGQTDRNIGGPERRKI